MVHLYTPESEIELLLLRSVLDEAEIRFYIRNEVFGSLAAGPQIEHFNRKSIQVAEADFEEAITLLREYHRRTGGHPPVPARRPALGERLRTLCGFLAFGWRTPGRRPPRRTELRLIKSAPREPSRPAADGTVGRPERPKLRLV